MLSLFNQKIKQGTASGPINFFLEVNYLSTTLPMVEYILHGTMIYAPSVLRVIFQASAHTAIKFSIENYLLTPTKRRGCQYV